jgi:hypothetical protein
MRLGDAGCGLTCRSAATIMAGCGLARPYACGRWLPVWLPGNLVSSANVRTAEAPDTCVSASGGSRIARLSGVRTRTSAAIIASIGRRSDRAVGTKYPQPR